MKIFHALVSFTAALVLSLGQSVSAFADTLSEKQPEIRLTSVMATAPYRPISFALDYMADFVSKRTGGKFTIQRRMSYGDVSSSDCLVKVIINTDDITVVPFEVISNFIPWLEIMDVPYLFSLRNYEELTVGGQANAEICKEISDGETRIIALYTWYTDFVQLVMRSRPVYTPGDLKGQRIWIPYDGPVASYLSVLGATPVVMPFNLAYENIRYADDVDGMAIPLNTLITRKQIFEKMRFVSLPSLLRGGYVVIVSQQRYDSLPPAYQSVLRQAAEEASAFLNDYNMECLRVVMGRLIRDPDIFINNPDLTRFVSQSEQLKRFFFKRYPKAVEKMRDTLNWQSNSGLIKDN